MGNFLIQTINGKIKHDFNFHLIQSIEYNNWFYNKTLYEYTLSETAEKGSNFIPVGTLEFVFEYTEKYHGIKKEKIKPINVPKELSFQIPFMKRKGWEMEKKEIPIGIHAEKLFIKSATKYKGYTDIIKSLENVPDDYYFVTEAIEIESEWRVFVHRGEMVGLQNYSGDFASFPDVSQIKYMIEAYKSSPVSYTLDVGINNEGTFIIEVHPFVSCGLYGFSDYKILPNMFIEGYKYFIK